jgi:D-glycero-alpha-D-manno-heptose 1-phosphate guanylyltransferase
MGNIPCIVLAGGLGTRLRKIVPTLPKCLAPIHGHSFLELQLQSLVKRGVDKFILALGYGADQVLDAINESWAYKLNINYVIEDEALGTGGAARLAMARFNLDEALIINGDTFIAGGLDEMLVPLNNSEGELMRMATLSVLDRSRYGGVEIDNSNYVLKFLEKGQTGLGRINAGLYRINRQIFKGEHFSSFSMELDIMPQLIERRALKTCELTGPFIDIGIPNDYDLFAEHYQFYVYKE